MHAQSAARAVAVGGRHLGGSCIGLGVLCVSQTRLDPGGNQEDVFYVSMLSLPCAEHTLRFATLCATNGGRLDRFSCLGQRFAVGLSEFGRSPSARLSGVQLASPRIANRREGAGEYTSIPGSMHHDDPATFVVALQQKERVRLLRARNLAHYCFLFRTQCDGCKRVHPRNLRLGRRSSLRGINQLAQKATANPWPA